MLDSVLSPNQSLSNQRLGDVSSPNSEDLGTFTKQQVLALEDDSSPEDVVDKENVQVLTIETAEKDRQNLDDDDDLEGEEEPVSSSPKRGVKEVSVDVDSSPESSSKKARTSDEKVETIDITGTESHKSKETTSSSKSVDDLLADLAKAKTTLEKSKDTLKLLKGHQQKLAESGTTMGERVEAFDKELTKLKETHAENGKALEKVLSIRDSAKESFQAAEEMLQRINEKKSKENTAVASSKDTTKEDLVESKNNEDASEELSEPVNEEEEEESPEQSFDVAEIPKESPSKGTIADELEAREEETETQDKKEMEEAVEADVSEFPVEAKVEEASSASDDDEAEEAATPEATESFEKPFDEKTIEGGNLDTVSTESDSELENDDAEEGDVQVEVKSSVSAAATIDDTLALELQNSDGSESGDSLISM